MRKFGVRRMKTPELELELEATPPVESTPNAAVSDSPTDEELVLWSTSSYEGPVPGQSAQRAQALIDAAVALGNDMPPEPNKDSPKS
jgi:hypothetical protein